MASKLVTGMTPRIFPLVPWSVLNSPPPAASPEANTPSSVGDSQRCSEHPDIQTSLSYPFRRWKEHFMMRVLMCLCLYGDWMVSILIIPITVWNVDPRLRSFALSLLLLAQEIFRKVKQRSAWNCSSNRAQGNTMKTKYVSLHRIWYSKTQSSSKRRVDLFQDLLDLFQNLNCGWDSDPLVRKKMQRTHKNRGVTHTDRHNTHTEI